MDQGARIYREYLAGNDQALCDIIERYRSGLTLFLNRYVHDLDLAEELTEDVFFRLVTKKPRFSDDYHFKTWLYTIGRNLAINHLKRAARQTELTPEVLERQSAESDALEDRYVLQERSRILYRALCRLRPEYSEALQLKYFEELSNAEIGTIMKKSRRQVENLIYQAKKALRAELKPEEFDDEDF